MRKLIEESGINLNDSFDGSTYLDIFLAPTQLYVKPILTLKEKVKIKGMNHITGGGFYENIPRGLPKGLAAKIDTQSFPTPKVFEWLQQQADIETSEMYNVFNMGIGYTVIVNKEDVYKTLDVLKEQDIAAYQIGKLLKVMMHRFILRGIDMTKVAIFASGSGSNFENIVSKVDKGQLNNIEITSLYTDHHDAYCIERAKQLKVMVHINEPKDFENKGEYEQN